MVTTASRSSYSPASRVWISSSDSAFWMEVSSSAAASRVSWSSSSSASSTMTSRSSMRLSILRSRSTLDCLWESWDVTFWASSGLSHRSGAAACCSSSVISFSSVSASLTAATES